MQHKDDRGAARNAAPVSQDTDPFIDRTKEGVFRDHSCWKCQDGSKPCVVGNPRQCEYPIARND